MIVEQPDRKAILPFRCVTLKPEQNVFLGKEPFLVHYRYPDFFIVYSP